MNKKFKIFMIIMIIFLTGCSATFDVDISDQMITQDVTISMKNNEITNKNVAKTLEDAVFNVEESSEFLGEFSIVNNNNNSNPLKATKVYNLNDYNVDYAIALCYNTHNINYQNNILELEANNFNCYNKYSMFDSVDINITTGYKVLNNNADKVNGNTYTWNITKNNQKSIKLTLDTTIDYKEKEEEKKDNKIVIVSICSIIVLSIISFIVLIFLKIQKSNEL